MGCGSSSAKQSISSPTSSGSVINSENAVAGATKHTVNDAADLESRNKADADHNIDNSHGQSSTDGPRTDNHAIPEVSSLHHVGTDTHDVTVTINETRATENVHHLSQEHTHEGKTKVDEKRVSAGEDVHNLNQEPPQEIKTKPDEKRVSFADFADADVGSHHDQNRVVDPAHVVVKSLVHDEEASKPAKDSSGADEEGTVTTDEASDGFDVVENNDGRERRDTIAAENRQLVEEVEEDRYVTPELRKGFILKQGHVIKNWKNRYFVLDAGILTYYESSSPVPPYGVKKKGEISLRDMQIQECKISALLEIASRDKFNKKDHLTLEIKYPNEREEWKVAIRQHIAYWRRVGSKQ